jgi:acyl-CoA reductase-like NAD-dependent aldehyde dehydrogenase
MATYTVPFIINGEEQVAKETFEVKSPSTGELVHLCGVATEAHANAAVEAAATAFPAWRDVGIGARRDIILKAAELMDQRRPELEQYLIDEMGVERGWALFNLNITIEMIKDAAGRVSSLGGYIPKPADPNTSAMVWREPYGVVLAIAPW